MYKIKDNIKTKFLEVIKEIFMMQKYEVDIVFVSLHTQWYAYQV